MSIQPLNDRVFITPDPAETTTKGGIILPEQAQKKESRGTVAFVGPGKRNSKGELLPMTVKVGDRVMYSKYAGTDVTIEDVDYIIMTDDTIHAILDK
jgi:chaperonin GroES